MEMEGNPASPMQIVQAHMIREDSGFMRDYILDEEGDITALYFYPIKTQE